MNQENIVQSQIYNLSNSIVIDSVTRSFDYKIGAKALNPIKVEELYKSIDKAAATISLLESIEINPYKLIPIRIGIKSIPLNILSFDFTQSRAAKPLDKYLLFDNMNISFPKNETDFGDLFVTFHNCNLEEEYKDRVIGKHLTFDRHSYDSFYSTKNQIYAFNNDDIEVTESYVYLQDEQFDSFETPLIHLNTFNSLNCRYGRSINFTGTESTLAIKRIAKNTKMLFKLFDDLNIISVPLIDSLSLSQVKKCTIKLSDEKMENVIDRIDGNDDSGTEIKTNANLLAKEVYLSNNLFGNSNLKIQSLNIVEKKKSLVQGVILTNEININDESVLTLKSCQSDEPITINIESTKFEYPQLVIEPNNNIKYKALNAILKDSSIQNTVYLLSGITQDQCDTIKTNTHIIDDNQNDITNLCELKCEDDSDSNKKLSFKQNSTIKNIKKGLTTGQKIGIVFAVIALVAIIILIIVLVTKKKKIWCFKEKDQNKEKSTREEP